ncbi:hypothetical protein [Paracoccus marcusii]|uniref:hypothetical protein n=1 Tax=Paracoccus marcusii TaxID=59779 RepID=UPI0035A61241
MTKPENSSIRRSKVGEQRTNRQTDAQHQNDRRQAKPPCKPLSADAKHAYQGHDLYRCQPLHDLAFHNVPLRCRYGKPLHRRQFLKAAALWTIMLDW